MTEPMGKPFEDLADLLEVSHADMRGALDTLELYVVSGPTLADLIERAVHDGRQAAELHIGPGVARLIREALAGPIGHGDPS